MLKGGDGREKRQQERWGKKYKVNKNIGVTAIDKKTKQNSR